MKTGVSALSSISIVLFLEIVVTFFVFVRKQNADVCQPPGK